MDPRRFVILAGASLWLPACATLPEPAATPAVLTTPVRVADSPVVNGAPASVVDGNVVAAVGPAGATKAPMIGRACLDVVGDETATTPSPVPNAVVPARLDETVGGVRVFAWSPGRVYEIHAAPLRVTTLTLGEGETLIAKAAGDTVRWQIGEAQSGEGAGRRSHVFLKPLERGLETNLVLTTNKRIYLIELRSGSVSGFNAAVAWVGMDSDPDPTSFGATDGIGDPVRIPDPVAMPEGPLDARYRVEAARGRAPRWTPSAVFNDGRRTFIAFDPDLQVDEAPALFVIASDGEAQLVNYRQAGGLFIVDRIFDQAELRLGDRRPQIVRIRRIQGGRS